MTDLERLAWAVVRRAFADAAGSISVPRSCGSKQEQSNERFRYRAGRRNKDEARDYIAEGCPGWGDLLGFSAESRKRMKEWATHDQSPS